jgi:hypothetical protein
MSYNLFSLQEQGDAGWAHGRAFATGAASASASFRRGMDLSASIDLEGGLGGDLGKSLGASLGGRASAGLSLQAAFPLDLFKEAGLVARLQAQAAAAAFVRAEVNLDADDFSELLRGRLSGPWLELVPIFLEEVRIRAGLWAHVSVSAQLLAEAAIVGNLLGPSPGFTCSLRREVGYGVGTGMDFTANFDLREPQRLFNRIANQLVAILERELQGILSDLPDKERDRAQRALPILRLVLPLAFQAAFEQGAVLAFPPTDPQAVASSTVVRNFIGEVQEQLSRALFDLALQTLNNILQSDEIADTILNMDSTEAAATTQMLQALRPTLIAFTKFEFKAEGWFEAVLKLLDAFYAVSSLVPPAQQPRWKDNLALAWSSAVLIRRFATWVSGPIVGETLALPVSGPIAEHIVNKLKNKRALATGLTEVDAINYILLDQARHFASLRASMPEIKLLLDLLENVFQDRTNAALLEVIFKSLALPDDATAKNMLPRLIAALQTAVEGEVLPRLLKPLEQVEDEGLVEIVRRVVKPTILSLTRVIVPGITTLGTEEAATILREQISAVLLQSLARFIVVSTDILAEKAAIDGVATVRDLAEKVKGGGIESVLGVGVAGYLLTAAAVSSGAGILALVFMPTPEDVSDILVLAADTIQDWNDNERPETFELIETLVSLGLTTGDADLDQLWTTLADQPKTPPLQQALERLSNHLLSGLWDLVKFIGPRLLAVVGRHFERLGTTIIEAVETMAKIVIEAAKQAAAWLDERIEDLEQFIRDLANDIKNAVANIAKDIARLALHIRGLMNNAIGAIRAEGWTIVREALFNNDVFRLLPNNVERSVEAEVMRMYNDAFNSVTYLLNMPLQAFALAAGWVHEALTHPNIVLSRDAILQYVRNRAASLIAQNLSFSIALDVRFLFINERIDLGVITIPAGTILGTVLNVLMSDALLHNIVGSSVNTQSQILAKTSQLSTTEVNLRDLRTRAEADQAVDTLTTGQSLTVRLDTPIEAKTYVFKADLRIVLTGANRTFLTNVLGVPARVKVLVNGQEYPYGLEDWVEEGGELVFTATVVPSLVGLAPRLALPPFRYVAVDMPQPFHYNVVKEVTGVRRFRALPVPETDSISPEVGMITSVGEPVFAHPWLKKFRKRPQLITLDPLLGHTEVIEESAPHPRPVIMEQLSTFKATAAELTAGIRWVQPEQLLDPNRETIVGRRGLNRVEVVVTDGSGLQAQAGRTFFLTSEV